MEQFVDDDPAYFAWLDANPRGFVVNVRRRHDPTYVVLHRATCPTIGSRKAREGAYTARGYRKWGCGHLVEAAEVARLEGRSDGSVSKACSLCLPLIP